MILDETRGSFFTWEQEQIIIEKLIYKNIYKDDLQGAIVLWMEEREKVANLNAALLLQDKETSRLKATIRRGVAILEDTDKKKVRAEEKYVKEEKRKRRWRRMGMGGTVAGAAGGLIFGLFLGQK